MKRYILTFALLLLTPLGVLAQQEIIPQILQHLDAEKGLQIEYTYEVGDHQIQGTYHGSGKQFYLESEPLKAWYDGANLWLYVAQNGEINLTTPEPAELAELNPLLALELISTESFHITSKPQGKGTLVTTKPKATTQSPLEWLEVEVDANNRPLWVRVKERGLEEVMKVTILSLKKGAYPEMKQKGFFSFQANKLPGVEVIDLR